jgi:hypothetical protein
MEYGEGTMEYGEGAFPYRGKKSVTHLPLGPGAMF